ncbi:unnamed protein product [Bathycoccus prasinos]
MKHSLHSRHLRCVPTPNVLVERRSLIKHRRHRITCAVFQLPMSWLNAEADLNIYPILVTWDVSQLPMSWLNAEAEFRVCNIPLILVTFDVFQLPMSWLNASAESNVRYILVTDDVSHAEISALNVLLPPKPLCTCVYVLSALPVHPLISVTRLTSQSGMVPKFVVDKPYVVHIPVTGDSAKQLAFSSLRNHCRFSQTLRDESMPTRVRNR